jgi:hypothetical protein
MGVGVGTLRAQDPLPPAGTDDRLRRMEERLDAMERQHQAELRQRDAEIARLRDRVDAPSSTATTRPSGGQNDLLNEIDGVGAAGTPNTDATKRAVAQDAADRNNPLMLGGPVSFNPNIAVIADFLGSYSSNRSNNALNRLDVREVELDLRAAVHPNADGVVILAFARDVENPPFPNADEPPEGPEGAVEVEEAYLFLHDFGVPNLTAKVGRFHVRFGRQNVLHLHDLPTSDPPLVNQAFLAPESLTDSGVSLSYVIPPRLIGNQYVEIVSEVLAGEGAGSESPTLRGDLSVDSPAFNNHILWNHDVAPNWNLELGGTWLYGHAGEDNGQDVNLFGADVTLLHRDPTGGFHNQLFQAEAIYGDTYDEDGVHRNGFGAYVLGQQQLTRDWYAGLRLDYTQNPNSDHDEAWAINPYVSFYWSEFLRFRMQYQYKDGDVPEEHNLFFQATWIFGAHPPHPYWSMR